MGHHIILAYLEEHPVTTLTELSNIYIYFKFKAYLQTTLKFTRKAYCIKLTKRTSEVSLMPTEELSALTEAACNDNAPETYFDLEWAIRQLNPAQSEIINLYYYRGKTDLEISEQRHVSRQAVNNLKRRALYNLRQFMSDSV